MVKNSNNLINKNDVSKISTDKVKIEDDELRKLVNFLNYPTKNNMNRILSFEPEKKKQNKNQKRITANVSKYGETLSNLDVSGIKDMSNLFKDFNFNDAEKKGYTIDITGWDVSKVTNMESMFANSTGFNQNLNGWNVFNVKNMENMFLNCKNLDKSFSNWTIQKDTKTKGIFSGCNKYKSFVNLGLMKKIGIMRLKGNENEGEKTSNGKGIYYPSGVTVEKNSYWTSH